MRFCVVIVLLLTIAAATAAVAAEEPDFDRASEEGLRLLEELILLDTSNPPGNEYLYSVLVDVAVRGE